MSASASQGRRRHPRTLPLRPLDLRGAPYAKRALAWSPDAELAVAVDDSVYVFVPQWPQPSAGGGEADEEAEVKEEGSDADEDNDDDGAAFPPTGASTETESRSQFATGSRHIPVAHPPLDGRINDRLFAAAAAATGTADDTSEEDADEDADDAEDAETPTATTGPGLLTGSGSTMRSVVALAWSPAGVGHNRRPVLGVLSADGLLGVYGEADAGDEEGQRGPRSGLGSSSASYDTARWSVLWAVGGGGRFRLPCGRGRRRQQEDRVVSFAWSGPLLRPPLQPQAAAALPTLSALLVYATDRHEVVVVSVGRWPSGAWRVVEAGRFAASGPHADTARAPGDPHFVPSGTAFGVHCSPFAAEADVNAPPGSAQLSCLVAYLADGYLGFRRVAVALRPDEEPAVAVDAHDTDGLCLFLGTDAFLVWEEAVWAAEDGRHRCRGVVATPMVARALEVTWAGSHSAAAPALLPQARPHDRTVCGTVYPPADEHHTNPIQDLILLPPPDSPGPAPLYTLVRQSATATNDDWYESNVPGPVQRPPGDEADDDVDMDRDDATAARPQWADDIARTVRAHVPAAIARMGEGDDEDEEDDEDVEDGYPAGDDGDGDGHGAGLRPLADHAAADDNLYLHRMRLWGVARAPGRGRRAVTAVLVTSHPAQHADRGGWYRDRSRVLFGWSPAGPAAVEQPLQALMPQPAQRPPLSAEARMWAWMYGGGEDPLASVSSSWSPADAAGGGAAAPVPLHPLVADQICSICGAPLLLPGSSSSPGHHSRRRGHRPGTTIACAHGHVFDRCGATGLAIPLPGISRVCGVCGSRTLRAGALAEALAAVATGRWSAEDLRSAEALLRQAIGGDVCGRCGGKFHE